MRSTDSSVRSTNSTKMRVSASCRLRQRFECRRASAASTITSIWRAADSAAKHSSQSSVSVSQLPTTAWKMS